MAYGLYDQAADLVRIAIARDPERRDLKLKLLEVFFVWGNKEQFLQSAHELASTRDQAAPGEWEKIVIMGKQLAPEDPLFSGGGGVSGAAAGGVDLDLEGGQSRVDFDLLGEPVPEDAAAGPRSGYRLGARRVAMRRAPSRRPRERRMPTSRCTALIRQSTQLRHHAPDDAHDEAAVPKRRRSPPSSSRSAARRQSDDSPEGGDGAPAERPGGEQTAELAIDDLGLDLGGARHRGSAAPGPPPMRRPWSRAWMSTRAMRCKRPSAPRSATGAGNAATGAWRVKPEDMDATLPPVAVERI